MNFYLPNNVTVPSVRVTRGVLPTDTDILVGMDIIAHGDFAVTNKGGSTKFSFRLPSVVHIDFVEEAKGRVPLSGQPLNRLSRRAQTKKKR